MKKIQFNNYIVADPDICHGKLTFVGTRVMVWQILEMLATGDTSEEILDNFPSITQKHIQAALNLAADRVGRESYAAFTQAS